MINNFSTITDLKVYLGAQIRKLRLAKGLATSVVAIKANIAEKSIRNLEKGVGSSTATLLGVLRVLEATEWLSMLAPQRSVDPMALLRLPTPRQRARRRTVKVTS